MKTNENTILYNKFRNQIILSIKNMEENPLLTAVKLYYFVVKQHYSFTPTVTVR